MVEATLSVNLREVFTALVSSGLMRYYDRTYSIPIPPGTTVTIERTVREDSVSLVSEEVYVVDRDNALSIRVEIDGIERAVNENVMQQTYSTPLNWMDLGAFTPIYRKLKVEITNNTSDLVNITITSRYGILPRSIYDRIMGRYLKTILEVVQEWKEESVTGVVQRLR